MHRPHVLKHPASISSRHPVETDVTQDESLPLSHRLEGVSVRFVIAIQSATAKLRRRLPAGKIKSLAPGTRRDPQAQGEIPRHKARLDHSVDPADLKFGRNFPRNQAGIRYSQTAAQTVVTPGSVRWDRLGRRDPFRSDGGSHLEAGYSIRPSWDRSERAVTSIPRR
jgi:hypothetical protein